MPMFSKSHFEVVLLSTNTLGVLLSVHMTKWYGVWQLAMHGMKRLSELDTSLVELRSMVVAFLELFVKSVITYV